MLRNPSCGSRKLFIAHFFATTFDRGANPFSLLLPLAAVEGVARAFRRSGSMSPLLFANKKTNPFGLAFCLAEKEGLEPSRRFPDLRP